MKPFIFLLWRKMSECFFYNFPAVNAPPYHSPQLQTRFFFFFFFLPLDDRGCKTATTPKGWDVNSIAFNIIGKVLIFFIIQLNNNSISPTKSTQFEGFTLIKMLIKNKNSQHLINYFYVSQGNDLNSLFCFFLSFLLENLSYQSKNYVAKTQFISV